MQAASATLQNAKNFKASLQATGKTMKICDNVNS